MGVGATWKRKTTERRSTLRFPGQFSKRKTPPARAGGAFRLTAFPRPRLLPQVIASGSSRFAPRSLKSSGTRKQACVTGLLSVLSRLMIFRSFRLGPAAELPGWNGQPAPCWSATCRAVDTALLVQFYSQTHPTAKRDEGCRGDLSAQQARLDFQFEGQLLGIRFRDEDLVLNRQGRGPGDAGRIELRVRRSIWQIERTLTSRRRRVMRGAEIELGIEPARKRSATACRPHPIKGAGKFAVIRHQPENPPMRFPVDVPVGPPRM